MEMKEYKVVVKNNEEAEEVRNLFELLGYKKESFHFNCYYPRSVVTQYRYEWLSTGHACDCENGEELTIQQLRDLVAQKQGLISGADALRALADGKEVEFFYRDVWDSIGEMIVIDHFMSDKFKFRLKPRTIKLKIEIPSPGTNYKHGQLIWILNSLEPHEYCAVTLDESDELPTYWWETEEEIKQVVSALRGALKNG